MSFEGKGERKNQKGVRDEESICGVVGYMSKVGVLTVWREGTVGFDEG